MLELVRLAAVVTGDFKVMYLSLLYGTVVVLKLSLLSFWCTEVELKLVFVIIGKYSLKTLWLESTLKIFAFSYKTVLMLGSINVVLMLGSRRNKYSTGFLSFFVRLCRTI